MYILTSLQVLQPGVDVVSMQNYNLTNIYIYILYYINIYFICVYMQAKLTFGMNVVELWFILAQD